MTLIEEELRVASTDGSKRIDPAEAGAPSGASTQRRARTAAEQRQDSAVTSTDPEVLTEEIERTREELAETLDAIADKVSPKRVAGRTKKQVGDAVKDGAAKVKGKAATAAETVGDKAASAKEAVGEKAATAKEAVGDKAVELTGKSDDGLQDVGQAPAGPATAPLASTYPGLHPVPSSTASPSPLLGAPALAGAAAALLVALFVLRRRRR